GIAIDRKITLVARSTADLVSQSTTINSTAEMTSLLNAAEIVMAPYVLKPKITISQVIIDATGTAKIDWSDVKNQTTLEFSHNDVVTSSIPATFRTCAAAPCYLLWSKVKYDYLPVTATLGYSFFHNKAAIPLADESYMRPRQSVSVAHPFSNGD